MTIYEVNWVIRYAHVFSKEIVANSQKEAKEKMESIIDTVVDGSMAEFDDYIIDKPIKI